MQVTLFLFIILDMEGLRDVLVSVITEAGFKIWSFRLMVIIITNFHLKLFVHHVLFKNVLKIIYIEKSSQITSMQFGECLQTEHTLKKIHISRISKTFLMLEASHSPQLGRYYSVFWFCLFLNHMW